MGKQGGGGGRGRGGRGRGRGGPVGARQDPVEAEPVTWLELVRKQVEFYFSDANLRKDSWMQAKIKENDGYIPVSEILRFGRLQRLRCRYPGQLVQAARKSTMLLVSADKMGIKRDLTRAPIQDVDPTPNTVYVEGLPLVLSVDDVCYFFTRYGTVAFVDLPKQKETREPLGFCFVEFSKPQEAAAAIAALDRTWPQEWPMRYDGKTLRLMPMQQWQDLRQEYRTLKQRGGSSSHQQPPPAPAPAATEATATSSSSAASTLKDSTGQVKQAESIPAPDLTMADKLPAFINNPAAHIAWVPKVRLGCLLRIEGFPQPQTVVTIRQFVEHAVVVEYCDFQPGSSVAYVRLRSPEDCAVLLQDLRLTRRQLGWGQPAVMMVDHEEESKYWDEVARSRADKAVVDAEVKKSAKVLEKAASVASIIPLPSPTSDRGGGGPCGGAALTPVGAALTPVGAALTPVGALPTPAPIGSGVSSGSNQAIIKKPKRRRVFKALAINPLGAIRGSLLEQQQKQQQSTVQVWRKARPPEHSEAQVASYIDTVCGNEGQTQPGFGRARKLRRGPDGTYRVVVPRKPKPRTGPAGAPIEGEDGEASASEGQATSAGKRSIEEGERGPVGAVGADRPSKASKRQGSSAPIGVSPPVSPLLGAFPPPPYGARPKRHAGGFPRTSGPLSLLPPPSPAPLPYDGDTSLDSSSTTALSAPVGSAPLVSAPVGSGPVGSSSSSRADGRASDSILPEKPVSRQKPPSPGRGALRVFGPRSKGELLVPPDSPLLDPFAEMSAAAGAEVAEVTTASATVAAAEVTAAAADGEHQHVVSCEGGATLSPQKKAQEVKDSMLDDIADVLGLLDG